MRGPDPRGMTGTANSASPVGALRPQGIDAAGRVTIRHLPAIPVSLSPARLLSLLAPPAPLVATFETALAAFSPVCPTSLIYRVDFIEEGRAPPHPADAQALFAERYGVFFAAARDPGGGVARIVPTNTGLHTSGLLRAGITGADVSGRPRRCRGSRSPRSPFLHARSNTSRRPGVLGFSVHYAAASSTARGRGLAEVLAAV